jgi:hypothetical protein
MTKNARFSEVWPGSASPHTFHFNDFQFLHKRIPWVEGRIITGPYRKQDNADTFLRARFEPSILRFTKTFRP